MKKWILLFMVLQLLCLTGGSRVMAQIPTQGLSAWYKFNELSNTIAIDSSGKSNNGSINGPTHQTGVAGTALNFVDNNNIKLPNNMLGSSNGSFTAWIKSSKAYTANGMLFYGAAQSGNGGGTQAELHVHFNSGGTLGIYSRIGNSTSGKDVSFNTSEKYNDNQWHHVAGTWNYNVDSKIMKVTLYVDGVKKGQSTYNNATTNLSTFNFSNVTYVGRSGSDASRAFIGLMDEVRIYNRQITDEEVSALAVLPIPEWVVGNALTISELKTKSLMLHWPAASERNGTNYNIYQGVGTSKTLLATITDSLNFRVIDLEGATKYMFSVEAGNSTGRNPALLSTSVTTRDDDEAPVWPANSALLVSESKATRVRLTWAPPYPTDNKGVTHFILYRNGSIINDSIAATENSYVVTGLSPETHYAFRIEAADASLNVSTNGPTTTIITPTDTDAPLWPENTRIAASQIEKSSFVLAWTPAVDDIAVTSYRVYQDQNLLTTTTANTLDMSGLTEGGTYTYKIEAGDANGNWSILGPSIKVALYDGLTKSVFEEINAFEPHFVLPASTGMKNIKTDFGAKGDGITDDTEAFKKWIAAKERSLYIPAGTYLLSEQLRFSDGMKRVTIMGEKRRTTILRLIDKAAGFNDPNKPKVFIHTRASNQQGEQNFANYIYHLTIEIGKNNPGTIALNYHTNNTGQLKDLTVRAEDPVNHPGLRGVAFDDYWFGPGGARYLEIDGFQEGVVIGSAQNHVTLEHVRIKHCDTALINNGNGCSLRKITITGSEQGIRNLGAGGLMAMQEISILDGAGGNALYNEGRLLVNGLTTSGYALAIASKTETGNAIGPDINHYTGTSVISNWPTAAGLSKTLGLAVAESPEFQYPQSSLEWAVTPASGDITAFIQQAIDNGVSTIYVAGGEITKTIHLRNKIQRIMGAGVKMLNFKTGSQPVFQLEDGASPAVILELLYPDYGSNTTVPYCAQASRRSFVLRHGGLSYETAEAGQGGKVFVESVVAYPFYFTKVQAWVRDINTEQGGNNVPNIVNDSSKVWILGQKTEDYAIKIKTFNGGATELMGGTYRQNWDAADGVNDLFKEQNPLFLVDNSVATFSFKTFASSVINYKYLVREIRGSETRNIVHAAYGGSYSGNQSLFVGRPCPPINEPAITPSGLTRFCPADSVILSSAKAADVTYQWFKNNEAITNATNPEFTAKETGNYTVQLMLNTGCAATSPAVYVDVLIDTIAPVIEVPADKLVSNDSGKCAATLDPGMATATDNCMVASLTATRSDGLLLTDAYPVGVTTLAWTATDRTGNLNTAIQKITVLDQESPVIVSANPVQIGPPNNKYITYTISDMVKAVTDQCEGNIAPERVTITGVESDETGNINSKPAYIIAPDAKSVQVMATRNGNGEGRIYTIRLAVTDSHANTGINEFKVHIQHDQGVANKSQSLVIKGEDSSGEIAGTGLVVYPNPANDRFTLQFYAAPGTGTKAELHISTSSGHSVVSEQIEIKEGFNSIVRKMPEPVPGMYFITIRVSGTVMRTKLVLLTMVR